MPFIKKEKRGLFDGYLNHILNNINNYSQCDSNSMMAYIIYYLVKKRYGNSPDWANKSDALKVLEDVKLQYYDDVLRPHANIKREMNGDI